MTLRALLLSLLPVLAACTATPDAGGRTLYDDLGGKEGVENLVVTAVRLAHSD